MMIKTYQKFKKLLSNIAQQRQGNITIEAAITFSIISILLVGGADFSRMILKQSQLEHVTRAGTQYGLRGQTDALDLDAVVAAARASIGPDGDALTITAENICRCPSAGVISCFGTCSDDSYPQMFLSVVAEVNIQYLFGYHAAPSETLRSTTVLRVR